MRLTIVLAFALAFLLAGCNLRGSADNHENVGQNAESLKEYTDADYDLSVAWPVYFHVALDTKEDAAGLAKALAGKGYEVDHGQAAVGVWWVSATKEFVPTLAAMDSHEAAVVAAADQFDGYYAGWELGETEEEGLAEEDGDMDMDDAEDALAETEE
jgi:hypothetical protein